MEVASLDIAKAYHNSPIAPAHKKYLCVFWKGVVYVQHVAIDGLSTAAAFKGLWQMQPLQCLKLVTSGP